MLQRKDNDKSGKDERGDHCRGPNARDWDDLNSAAKRTGLSQLTWKPTPTPTS